MRYFGGKGTIANELHTLINQWMKPSQEYIEPFVGSAFIVKGIKSSKRVASDTNPYLIAMYKALQTGWSPPSSVSDEEFAKLKAGNGTDEMRGFVGCFCCFGGMWFSNLAKDNSLRNAAKKGQGYIEAARNGVMRLKPLIQNVEFKCQSYDEYNPTGAFIYCDPPYDATNQPYFSKVFDSDKFWDTMRKWSKTNTVIISEYKAPDDFPCIESFRVRMKMNREHRFEKVFSLNKRRDPFQGIF